MHMNARRTIAAIAIIIMVGLSASAQRRSAGGTGGTIPDGTQVQVRFIDNLTSETANEGSNFHATLEQAIVANGQTLYPKGADVTGQIVRAHRSGRLSDPGELELVLTSIAFDGRSYPVQTQPFQIKGESHTKSNVGKIGGGAALGTIIGAIAGGGKGAAIGAGVGAGAGTGVAAATGKKEAKIESEAVLTFVASGAPGSNWPANDAARREDDRRPASDGDRNRPYDDDRNRSADNSPRRDFAPEFTRHDRREIRSCFAYSSNLPPGLAKRDSLPPGLEKQVERNGTLPPGLQKRAQPLPDQCNSRLPRLPADWSRVVLGGRVLLLDPGSRIEDLFWLDEED
jgi:hypothetical protein